MLDFTQAVAPALAAMALRQVLRDAIACDPSVVAVRVDVDAQDVGVVWVNERGDFVGGGSL